MFKSFRPEPNLRRAFIFGSGAEKTSVFAGKPLNFAENTG
jgi:hypothetical protein